VTAAPAGAQAQLFTSDGADPSASGSALVWEPAGGGGVVMRDGRVDRVPGEDPAVGPGTIAWHDDTTITLAGLDSFEPKLRFSVPGALELALSQRWLAWLARDEFGTGRIYVVDLDNPTAKARVAARSNGLGRPSLDGDRLVYDVAGTKSSKLSMLDLVTGERATLRRATGALLLNPTLSGNRLLYVESRATRQRVRLADLGVYGSTDRTLYSTWPTARRDAGHEPHHGLHHAGYPDGVRPKMPSRPPRGLAVTLWTTALAGDTAYVTSLRHVRGAPTQASLFKVPILPVSRRR
jgi:hypothetical protein